LSPCARDEHIEAATQVAFPVWHGRDVSLYGDVSFGLGYLWIAAGEKHRLRRLLVRNLSLSFYRSSACQALSLFPYQVQRYLSSSFGAWPGITRLAATLSSAAISLGRASGTICQTVFESGAHALFSIAG